MPSPAPASAELGASPGVAGLSSELLMSMARCFVRQSCGADVSLPAAQPLEQSPVGSADTPERMLAVSSGESHHKAA